MATAYDCKFIETSVGINHNVDELLVGLLSQIRLKLENPEKSRYNCHQRTYTHTTILFINSINFKYWLMKQIQFPYTLCMMHLRVRIFLDINHEPWKWWAKWIFMYFSSGIYFVNGRAENLNVEHVRPLDRHV